MEVEGFAEAKFVRVVRGTIPAPSIGVVEGSAIRAAIVEGLVLFEVDDLAVVAEL